MIHTAPEPVRILAFLREHRGSSFCFECLDNILAIPKGPVRRQPREAIGRTLSSVETWTGSCSICRHTRLVLRHKHEPAP